MSYFNELVSLKNVIACGVTPGTWTQNDQSLLTESMMLACKENPDWTIDEAKNGCARIIEHIQLNKFKKIYKYAICKTNYWSSIEDAYEDYIELGEEEFDKKVEFQIEYQEFCELFYDELRTRYNACSQLVFDEFQRMKNNRWSFSDYRNDLNKRKKTVKN